MPLISAVSLKPKKADAERTVPGVSFDLATELNARLSLSCCLFVYALGVCSNLRGLVSAYCARYCVSGSSLTVTGLAMAPLRCSWLETTAKSLADSELPSSVADNSGSGTTPIILLLPKRPLVNSLKISGSTCVSPGASMATLKVWCILRVLSLSVNNPSATTGAELCLERVGVACCGLKRTRREGARVGEGKGAAAIRCGLCSPSAAIVDVALTE